MKLLLTTLAAAGTVLAVSAYERHQAKKVATLADDPLKDDEKEGRFVDMTNVFDLCADNRARG